MLPPTPYTLKAFGITIHGARGANSGFARVWQNSEVDLFFDPKVDLFTKIFLLMVHRVIDVEQKGPLLTNTRVKNGHRVLDRSILP